MIKVLITDMDGCLTDNKVSIESRWLKNAPRFSSTYTNPISYRRDYSLYDLAQIERLNEAGIPTIMISGADVASHRIFAESCGATFIDVKGPKIDYLQTIADKIRLSGINVHGTEIKYYLREHAMIVGNDMHDLELLKLARLSVCPSDANIQVLMYVENSPRGIVTETKGGEGVIMRAIEVALLTGFMN